MGTKRGLNQFVDRRTLPFTTSEGLPSNDTGPVFQDPRGVIWVGTLGAGLARFDGRKSSVLTRRDGLSSNSILALAGDAKGTLWVGTDAGLDQINNGKIARILPGAIRSLYQDDEGTLWIGTSKGPAVLRSHKIVRLGSNEAVVSFVEASGKILAAVDGLGVKAYDERTLQELSGPGRPWLRSRDSGCGHALSGRARVRLDRRYRQRIASADSRTQTAYSRSTFRCRTACSMTRFTESPPMIRIVCGWRAAKGFFR